MAYATKVTSVCEVTCCKDILSALHVFGSDHCILTAVAPLSKDNPSEQMPESKHLEHLLFAGLGNCPLPFQLSLGLMPQPSHLLRAQHTCWPLHALQITPDAVATQAVSNLSHASTQARCAWQMHSTARSTRFDAQCPDLT